MRGYSHGRRKTWPLQGLRVVKEVVSATVVRFPSQRSLWGAERVPRLRVWRGVQAGHSGAERVGLGSGAVVRKAFDSVQPTAFDSQAKKSNTSKLPYDELIHHGSLSLSMRRYAARAWLRRCGDFLNVCHTRVRVVEPRRCAVAICEGESLSVFWDQVFRPITDDQALWFDERVVCHSMATSITPREKWREPYLAC